MFKKLKKVSTKQVYWHLLSVMSTTAPVKNKWNEKLDFEIDETHVEHNIYKQSEHQPRYLSNQFPI